MSSSRGRPGGSSPSISLLVPNKLTNTHTHTLSLSKIDLVSGDALFQELRQFFDQAARNPVNKEGGSASGSGDTSAHWQVVYSVCRTTFASHTVEGRCRGVSNIPECAAMWI